MLWAVIMAGGFGTRFWPESRRERPKQFLRFFGPKTLVEATADRLRGLLPSARTLVVTQADKVPLVRKTLTKIPRSQVWGEPAGRNTAPCAILAASWIAQRDPDGVLALLPADHHIKRVPAFRRALRSAARAAAVTGLPVTFGIRPACAHTGYGYLETGKPVRLPGAGTFRALKRFCEKPALGLAKKYVRSGRYLWNSGMFVWKASALLAAARKYLPKAYALAQKITAGDFASRMKKDFANMPSISIDYGLMEKLRGRILALPSDFGWSDLGSWTSFAELCRRDGAGNVACGKTLFAESEGNIVRSGTGRLVALLGAKGMVVVDTPDVLLVCAKERTESIRQVVAALRGPDLARYR
ncbi:MAG: mannose-1-phosphate guanylyltransferase [Candidatus Omnitrophota bacterium]